MIYNMPLKHAFLTAAIMQPLTATQFTRGRKAGSKPRLLFASDTAAKILADLMQRDGPNSDTPRDRIQVSAAYMMPHEVAPGETSGLRYLVSAWCPRVSEFCELVGFRGNARRWNTSQTAVDVGGYERIARDTFGPEGWTLPVA